MNVPYIQVQHKSGAAVLIPLDCPATAADINREVDFVLPALLNDGFTLACNAAPVPTQPEESTENIGYVLKRIVDSANHPSGLCPRVYLYSDKDVLKRPVIAVYLNTDAEIADFERLSGVKLTTVPKWIGKEAPEKGDRDGAEFIVPTAPLQVVIGDNPQWKQSEYDAAKAAGKVYKYPRKRLVRFVGGTAPQGSASVPSPSRVLSPFDYLKADHTVEEFNAHWSKNFRAVPVADQNELWDAIKSFAFHPSRNWDWNEAAKKWVAPKSAPLDDQNVPF